MSCSLLLQADPSNALKDVDGDGFNNWKEFIAGTDLGDPSNARLGVSTESN